MPNKQIKPSGKLLELLFLFLNYYYLFLLEEKKAKPKQKIRCATECKCYHKKLENNDFARIVQTIKEAKIINVGIMVSYSGFARQAKLVAKTTGIRLVHLRSLKTIYNLNKKAQKIIFIIKYI